MIPWKRALLKLSGEALSGGSGEPLSPEILASLASQVREVAEAGVQLGVVVGGGNIVRGAALSRLPKAPDRPEADQMGMLGTVINALALRAAFEAEGLKALVQSAIPMPPVAHGFDRRAAIAAIESGAVALFAAGTGHPFFTTDTAAVLRAVEIGAEALWKATNVDGVYDRDPRQYPGAVRFDRLDYMEALSRRLKVMDMTAFSLAMENRLPIVVFDLNACGNLGRVARGESVGTIVEGSHD
ncbi:MAG: UMP kinase [Armatimonadetes bacterium]|nr:UMP kinase [Armatimonadota bacterium]